MTFGGILAAIDSDSLNIAVGPGVTDGFFGETAQGGPIENKGYLITATGNHAPVVTTAPTYTIPLRTPFALTGSATDSDGDTVTYMWEQNDRGGISGGSNAGTALVNNIKTNGPLFRQFGTAANVSATDTLLSPSPGLNAVTTDPTRVFPDIGAGRGRQHERQDRGVPDRSAGPGARAGRHQGLLLGVPADVRLGRLPGRPDDELPPDRA